MTDTNTLTDTSAILNPTPADDPLAPSPLRPIPEDTQFAIFERLRMLREQKLRIEQEIRLLAGDDALWERVPAHCKRCGWDWTPFNPFMPPLTCPRCGSTSWNRKPTAYSRKPSDPPAPSWRQRKGGPQKHGDSVIRYRARDLRRSKKIPPLPQTPTTPPAPWEIAPLESPVSPWAKSIAIPPPPSPTAPPRTPLSQQLVQLRDDAYEPQPERATSHLAPPPSPSTLETPPPRMLELMNELEELEMQEEANIEEPDDGEPVAILPDGSLAFIEEREDEPVTSMEPTQPQPSPPQPASPLQRLGEITPPAPDALAPATADAVDVPPEQIGVPRTDAEREELQRAKEDVWPTTRSDD